jgi:hypothetical protein
MLNPFGPQREPGLSSYIDLKKRLLKKVQATNVNDQIFVVVQNAFENAMNSETPIILLSRPERKRLFSQILRAVLEDMIRKMDDRSNSTPA